MGLRLAPAKGLRCDLKSILDGFYSRDTGITLQKVKFPA